MISQDNNILVLSDIKKTYPGIVANDNVSMTLKTGTIHALLGENGAGKSTLVKIIYGLVKPDHGSLVLNQNPYKPDTPQIARKSGIGMVFQHFSLFEALNVAENVALGLDKNISVQAISKEIVTVSKEYGLPIDPKKTVGNLSAGERQRIEIVRCLLQKPKLLIMDEPTSVLTPNEIEELFKTLKKLASSGTSILYISHKLEEVRKLCDKATILRNGKVVKECNPKNLTASRIAELMVGEKIKPSLKTKNKSKNKVLEIKNLSLQSEDVFGTNLKNINLTLYEGEILAIAGVAGSGQTELMAILTGERLIEKNYLFYFNKDIGKLRPSNRRKIGLLTAPEERLGHAAAPEMSLIENVLITSEHNKNLLDRGLINFKKTKDFADKIISKFNVKTPHSKKLAKALSGGNLQKFLIGREINQNPKVLVINQPTWGVDASAAQFIRQSLLDLTKQGSAIIVISQDLDELIDISDRFTAVVNGSLSEPKRTETLTVSQIGLMLSSSRDSKKL
jgi:simple sugar transport system ATP-binding protein